MGVLSKRLESGCGGKRNKREIYKTKIGVRHRTSTWICDVWLFLFNCIYYQWYIAQRSTWQTNFVRDELVDWLWAEVCVYRRLE